MKRKDYNVLIEGLKIYAQRDPAGYRRRVMMLGILGYGYIFLVVSVLLGLIAGIVWLIFSGKHGAAVLIKVLIFGLFLVGYILKSLWIKIDAPTGEEVTRDKAPALFAIIDDICRRQNSAAPHKVLLTGDFNAFVSQVPSLGIFGWYKNYLVLGIPYMLSCNAQQFKAVIAHEFGHFSGSHGRMGTWIYRVRSSWYNIMQNFQNSPQSGNFLFSWFFNWYVPYFNAYSFVLAREQEYEADRYATAYAGAQANAEDLVNSTIKGTSGGLYWRDVWQSVNNQELPPRQVFTQTRTILKQVVPESEYQAQLKKVLQVRTQNFDTHPALRDRLAALGYLIKNDMIVDQTGQPLILQRNFERSAAEELLGEGILTEVLARLDEDWYKNIEGEWKNRHEEVKKIKQKLAELEQKSQVKPLTEDELFERAQIIDAIGTKEESIKAISDILTCNPKHAPALYRLGEILIADDDDKGVEHLRAAMQINPAYSSACLEKISWYLECKGEYGKVENYLDKLEETSEIDRKDYEERNSVSVKDEFIHSGLTNEVLLDAVSQFKRFEKDLLKIYLVQKVMKVYAHEPLYIFVIEADMGLFQMDRTAFNQKVASELAQNIALKTSAGTVLFLVGDDAILKKVKKVPEALIWKKG